MTRANQDDAINAFFNHYYENGNNKGILSMCCGSGKTYTFWEIARRCYTEKGDRIFMYITSRLLLIWDIVKNMIIWSKKCNIDIDIIVQASEFDFKRLSDTLLKEDAQCIPQKKLKEIVKMPKRFSVFNNLSSYIGNADSHGKMCMIVTTYESCGIIVDAFHSYNSTCRDEFRIGIGLLTADEAHNLACGDTKKIADGLLDRTKFENFNVNKMLFMTATPLAVIKRNKNSGYIDDNISYSMNNKIVFGEVFYEFPFSEGIAKKYIVEFDVIHLQETLDSRFEKIHEKDNGLSRRDKEDIYFDTISFMLLSEVRKRKIRRVIVYLSRCETVDVMRKKLEYHKTSEVICQITSKQSVKDKRNNITSFECDDNTTKILLSVDIFNEGFDVPICDCVFFAEERKSEIVITQNIGRALRLHPGKIKAYVIIPATLYYSIGDKHDYVGQNSLSNKICSKRFVEVRDVCDIMKGFANVENSFKTKIVTAPMSQTDTQKTSRILRFTPRDTKSMPSEELAHLKRDAIESINAVVAGIPLANVSYTQFKSFIRECHLTNLKGIMDIINKNSWHFYPHQFFIKDWICYGDFLYDEVFTYEDSVAFIEHLRNNYDGMRYHSGSHLDWIDFYSNALLCELKGIKHSLNASDFDKLIRIPQNPRAYYLKEWSTGSVEECWDKFLGITHSNNRIDIIVSCENESHDGRFHNIINNDKKKFEHSMLNGWHDFNNDAHLVNVKGYIERKFNVTAHISTRFKMTAGKYDALCIAVKPTPLRYYAPIIITDRCKIKYDPDVLSNAAALVANDVFATERKLECECYIDDATAQGEINKTVDLIIKYIKAMRANCHNDGWHECDVDTPYKIKQFIDNKFNINCVIVVRYLINGGFLRDVMILARPPELHDYFPIVLHKSGDFQYADDIYNDGGEQNNVTNKTNLYYNNDVMLELQKLSSEIIKRVNNGVV